MINIKTELQIIERYYQTATLGFNFVLRFFRNFKNTEFRRVEVLILIIRKQLKIIIVLIHFIDYADKNKV